MLTSFLHRTGLRGWHCHVLSLASIGLCVGLWIRAKTVDQDMRGNAERRALFAETDLACFATALAGM